MFNKSSFLKCIAYVIDILNLVLPFILMAYTLISNYALEIFGYALSIWAVIVLGLSWIAVTSFLRRRLLPSAILKGRETLGKEGKHDFTESDWLPFLSFAIVVVALVGIAVFFGWLNNNIDKRKIIAESELVRLKENSCVLNGPQKLVFSKYTAKPVYVDPTEKQLFAIKDEAIYITDKISLSSYDRRTEKTNRMLKQNGKPTLSYGLITYECQDGTRLTSKFRFRELMTNVDLD
jgi:hypothetical protein